MSVSKSKESPKFRVGRFVFGVDVPNGLNELRAVLGQIRVLAVLPIQAGLSGVARVPLVAGPLKVFRSIVQLVAVDVVDRLASELINRESMECFCHKSVNQQLLVAERDHEIAKVRPKVTFQDARTKLTSSPIGVDHRSRDSSDSPEVRCLKKTIKTRHWFPDFEAVGVFGVHRLII